MSSSKKSNTVLQLVFSTLAVLTAWGVAFVLAAIGLLQAQQMDMDFSLSVSIFILAAVSFFAGCLVIPSAVFSLRRLQGVQPERVDVQVTRLNPNLLLILFALALWLGDIAAGSQLAWLLLPFFHILAIGAPVLWLVTLTVRRLPVGSMQRRWGVFASGLVLGPALIMTAEIIALVALLILAGLWLATQPQLVSDLQALAERMAAEPVAPDEMLQLVLPYVQTPAVFAIAVFFAALVVPVIEEIFKPIGVWLLLGRKMTPAAGFAAGAISGAGYALFESLLLASSGENWAFAVLARLGTTAIHIFTCAIIGWALVGAWQEKKVLRLLGIYAVAVIVHGLWNGMTMVSLFSSLAMMAVPPPGLAFVSQIAFYTPFVLGSLAAIAFATLFGANHKLANSVKEYSQRNESNLQP